MTRLPAISMSSIMSVELHFEQEAGSYFNCKERAPHATDGLPKLSTLAVETYMSSTQTDRSNDIK